MRLTADTMALNCRLDVGCRKVTYQPLTSWLPNFSVIISLDAAQRESCVLMV